LYWDKIGIFLSTMRENACVLRVISDNIPDSDSQIIIFLLFILNGLTTKKRFIWNFYA